MTHQGACPFNGIKALGDNATTAVECQAGAIKSGANTINYNNDPGAAVGPRCRMQHCASPQAPTESHTPWQSWTAFAIPVPGGDNITIVLAMHVMHMICGHGIADDARSMPVSDHHGLRVDLFC